MVGMTYTRRRRSGQRPGPVMCRLAGSPGGDQSRTAVRRLVDRDVVIERQAREEPGQIVDQKVERAAEEATGPLPRIGPVNLAVGSLNPRPRDIPPRESVATDRVRCRQTNERPAVGSQQQVELSVRPMPLRHIEFNLNPK